jgi:light-regulated signal transduction histidine kinase (bacteriophytochrome)
LEETDGLYRSNRRIPLLRSSVLLAQNGEPVILEAFVDISARKQAERERDEYRDHLEELVQARTAALNTVNEELEAFCYSVSHDLRTPLRAIDGFSAALHEDYNETLDVVGKEYIRRIRNGTERMGRLIDDLLDLSRVTRSELRCTTADLSALARDIVDNLQKTDLNRRVHVAITDGLRVQGDARLLHIALENLLGNAWKYTRNSNPGEIVFGVSGRQEDQVFFIRDNGAGFDMRYANKLFGVFQRLHRDDEFEGTGIGLATVYRIFQRHGGRVWAEASPGSGATFYFTLRG